MTHRVRRYIVAGLLVWLPLAITIWVLLWLLGLMDGVFSWLLTIGQHVLPTGADSSIESLRRVPFLGVVVMVSASLGGQVSLLGNALAVVHGADGLGDEQMAAFARWTNLSETTFLLPPTP